MSFWESLGLATPPSLALLLAAWLARQWISTRLAGAIGHDFDQKLEQFRSEHRRAEEELRAQLVERGAQLAALQEGSMSGLTVRQAVRVERQFQAIEALWDSARSRASHGFAARVMQGINFAEAVKEAPTHDGVRKMFQDMIQLAESGKRNAQEHVDVSRYRLHVSPLTWSLFRAHSTVAGYSMTKMKMLAEGTDASHLFNDEHMVQLAKAALPHQSDFIDEHGIHSLDFLVDELEQKLFAAFSNELQGKEEDADAVKRAAMILDKINRTKREARDGSLET